jgi:hypothetical protein
MIKPTTGRWRTVDQVDDRVCADADRRKRCISATPLVDSDWDETEPVDVPLKRALDVNAAQHQMIESNNVHCGHDSSVSGQVTPVERSNANRDQHHSEDDQVDQRQPGHRRCGERRCVLPARSVVE